MRFKTFLAALSLGVTSANLLPTALMAQESFRLSRSPAQSADQTSDQGTSSGSVSGVNQTGANQTGANQTAANQIGAAQVPMPGMAQLRPQLNGQVDAEGALDNSPAISAPMIYRPSSGTPLQAGVSKIDSGLNAQDFTGGVQNANFAGGAQNAAFAGGANLTRMNGTATAMNAGIGNQVFRGNVGQNQQTMVPGGISVVDLNRIGAHDVVLIIDRSSSMDTPDCPSLNGGKGFLGGLIGGAGLTRWDWCKEQAMALAQQTNSVLPRGLTVELFSSGNRIFTHVNVTEIPQIFHDNQPGGFTMEAGAVKKVLDDYFSRRSANKGNVKPLLIAVITDGLPTNKKALRDTLIEATYAMRAPGEIKITFLQVGRDPEGVRFVQEMAYELPREGARYNVCSSHTFDQLVHEGLTRALVDCISEHSH